jgi:hypothetical protein
LLVVALKQQVFQQTKPESLLRCEMLVIAISNAQQAKLVNSIS